MEGPSLFGKLLSAPRGDQLNLCFRVLVACRLPDYRAVVEPAWSKSGPDLEQLEVQNQLLVRLQFPH